MEPAWGAVREQWDAVLGAAAVRLFPEYTQRVMPLKEMRAASEIQSNLTFQMLMYFNVLLYPIRWFRPTAWNKFQTLFLLLSFVVIEPVRLWLGYIGNMKERVPDLSGCFIFTLFPQLLISFYFMVGQPYMGRGFTLPFETAVNLVYMAMLVCECVFGYLAARRIVRSHSIHFFAMASEGDGNDGDVGGRGREGSSGTATLASEDESLDEGGGGANNAAFPIRPNLARDMFNFGAQQQPQAGAAGGGLFGAAATPTTQVAGGGLFGAPATQAPAAQGLFGAATPTPAGGGLFGQKPAATTAPAAGLFGAPAGNAAPATTAATPAAAGGLTFGAPAAAGAAGGLFGAKPTTQPLGAQPTAWQAQPKAATTGAPAAAANPAAAATQPAQQITAKTKYADLPDNVRQKIDEIEKFIQQQIHISDSIGNSTMDEPIAAVSEEVQVIMQRLVGVRNLLQRDQHVMDELKKQVNQELRNTDLASRYIDRAQNAGQSKFPAPQQDAYASYFNTFANDLERRMQMYRQNIEEIELNVRNMMVSPGRYTPQVIQEIIRNQYEAFIRVASKSAHMHDEIERERAKFEKFCQKYMGEARPGRLFSEGSLTGGVPGAAAGMAAGAAPQMKRSSSASAAPQGARLRTG
ncbi:hypothetical protein HK105_206488 [Polyrhizophydium stewartii]|uniref:Uncharacterized protein n=1 Tax=Polyrhizophydium stewartii TaxID=2732419 RepID=A0ABR4N3J6_9FUNG